MESIDPGTSLLVTFYQLTEEPREEGQEEFENRVTYKNLGEVVIEENPNSADRHPDVVCSFFATIDDGQERSRGVIAGFQRARSAVALMVEGLRSLGFVQ